MGGRGQRVCRLVCNSRNIGGPDRDFLFTATRQNKLWWLSEKQVHDICFRCGFSESEYTRIQEEACKQRALSARYAAKVEDEEPGPDVHDDYEHRRDTHDEDLVQIKRFVKVFTNHHMIEERDWTRDACKEHALKRCYGETPYGQRYAVNYKGRSRRADLPRFTRHNQETFYAHMATRQSEASGDWETQDHIAAEEEFFAWWRVFGGKDMCVRTNHDQCSEEAAATVLIYEARKHAESRKKKWLRPGL